MPDTTESDIQKALEVAADYAVIVCRYCDTEIKKVRTVLICGRVWRWATVNGEYFYCPIAGGECKHEPKDVYAR